jgi:Zn-dependent protease
LEFAARRVSLSVEPSFWLVMGMLTLSGGMPSTGDGFARVLLLFVVFAVSLLVHEGGHACAVLLFGGEARIRLHGMGGETRHALKLSGPKQFLVTSAGPLAGLVLAAASYALFGEVVSSGRPLIGLALFLSQLVNVNVFWSAVNLLPILPMDGGRLLSIVLIARFGDQGQKFVYGLAVVLGGAVALAFAYLGQWFGAATFGLFAASGVSSWRRLSSRAPEDEDPALRKELQDAERLVIEEKNDEAIRLLVELRKKTSRGRIHGIATELLGLARLRSGQRAESHQLLSEVADQLSYPSRVLLTALSCESGDRDRALVLGRTLFLEKRDPYVAYLVAAASAGKGDAAGALRWLKTAVRGGLRDAARLLKERDFDAVRNAPEFAEIERLARGER